MVAGGHGADLKLVELTDELRVHAPSPIDARFLYKEIFQFCCYGDLGYLPPAPLVVDIGANIGMFLLFVKQQRPDAAVIAFEPAPIGAAATRRNIEYHRLGDVVLHETAVGSCEHTGVPFTYYPLIPCNSTMYPADQTSLKAVMSRTYPARVVERMYQGRKITVSVVRLSRFLDDTRPIDLLKVDAVGAELDVLAGIDPRHWSLVRRVVVDVQDLEHRVDAACDVLRGHGLEPSVRDAAMSKADGLNYLVEAIRA